MNVLEDAQISCLLDIANAGCHKGCVLEARTIYENILVMKPGHVPALIGLALSYIVVNEHAEAEARLRDILAKHENDADAKCLLGFCLILQKKDEGFALLASLKDRGDSAGSLAKTLLEGLSHN